MNVITIQNLCNYLEELGIVDKKSITPFLSLYTKEINKNINNIDFDDSNSKSNSIILILENVLCSYLKKIFNIEKNYRIFSHKIIEKFKQNYLIKQYNALFLLFFIFSKRMKYLIFNSYYTIKQYIQEEKAITNEKVDDEDFNDEENNHFIYRKYINNNKNKKYNSSDNNYHKNIFLKFYNNNNNNNSNNSNNNNSNFNDNSNTIKQNNSNNLNNNYENGNGNGISDNDIKYIYKDTNKIENFNKKKTVNFRNKTSYNIYTKKAKSLNNSANFMKRLTRQQKSFQTKTNSIINKMNKNSNYNNIQFENKKNQFLSRIKKDHSINFKRREKFSNGNISRINHIKSKENKIINYIEYNKNNSLNNSVDSYNKNNNNDFSPEHMDNFNKKKRNILTNCYSHNNYDTLYDIYHLKKSKTSLDNKYSNMSINNYKNNQKEINNGDNLALNINGEISSINSNKYLKNGNLVFNQNYIGMKSLKYNFCSNDNIISNNKIENRIDIEALTSNESSIESEK